LVLVLGYVTVNLLSFTLFFTANRLNNDAALLVAAAITVLLNFALLVVGLVSVWRCAGNTRFFALTLISRALVILAIGVLGVQLVQGFRKGWRMIEDRRQQQSSEWPSNMPFQGSLASGVAAVSAP
jgi:hypothetical protein